MTNKILTQLQARLGKELSDSPSGLGRWLRGTLRNVEKGALTIDFDIREEMTNPIHILHGGALAAIMDEVMGMTAATLDKDTFYTSINLVIDFLSSGKPGETITARSRIVREGKNIVNTECIITNADGKLLAKGTSNLIRTEIPKS